MSLAYITNDSTRKTTFLKRKTGFVKKMKEITTLCDIDACTIIYSPYDPKPEVFSSSSGVQQILTSFKTMPQRGQSNKILNQESFLQRRIDKANNKLNKLKKENREKEITRLMFWSLTGGVSVVRGLNILDLKDLSRVIDQNLKEIDERIERLGGRPVHDECNPQLPPLPQPDMVVQQDAAEGMLGSGGDGERPALVAADMNYVHSREQPQPQWFLDMMKNCPEEEYIELDEE